MSMKMHLKALALMMLLMGSSSVFAQLTVEETSNQRTNGLYDGVEALTYNFDQVTEYKLMRTGEGVIMKGYSDSAVLGVLVPGSYAMMYTRKDGRVVLDQFVVEKK